MRVYNEDFATLQQQRDRRPRWAVIIYFDDAKTDAMALTSHSDFTTGVSNEFQGVLTVAPSGVSQSYDPANATSSIGGLSIRFADPDRSIADLVKTKADADSGIRRKPVDIYQGHEGLAWVDFEQTAGMIVGPIGYSGVEYEVKLSDVQREQRRDIFIPQVSTLTQSISDGTSDPGQTAIPITSVDLTKFPTTEKDTSYVDCPAIVTTACSVTVAASVATFALSSGTFPVMVVGQTFRTSGFTTAGNNAEFVITGYSSTSITAAAGSAATEAAGDTVTIWPQFGYAEIEDEVVKHAGLYTDGTYGVSLRVIERGALGTTAVAHDVDPGAAADRRTKVEERILIEGPAVKLLYAALTGVLYGQTGQTWPDHWHLGISTDFVRLTDFEAIGSDWWDTTDPTEGRKMAFRKLGKEDGKRWLEKEVLLWLGARMPVYADGALGLRRLPTVAPTGGAVFEFNPTNTISIDSMTYDTESVVNRLTVDWNFAENDDFLQRKEFIDADSLARNKDAPPRAYKFKGVHTSVQTDNDLADHFEAIRSRYADPPWRVRITASVRADAVEVGDPVRLNFPQVYDLASSATLDRVFEVLAIQTDYQAGTVSYDLIGSTAKPGPLDPFVGVTRLDNAAYGANVFGLGTAVDLTTVASIDGSGNLLSNVSLSGDYYYDAGDFSYTGRTITLTGTTRIAVKGEVTPGTGIIDGVGAGKAGGTGAASVAASFGVAGTAGFFGTPRGMGGVVGQSSYIGTIPPVAVVGFNKGVTSTPGKPTLGTFNDLPPIAMKNNGTSLVGLPADLDGSGGSAGGASYWLDGTGTAREITAGGNGGAGGAGLVWLCRGFQAPTSGGQIDLSGDPGNLGGSIARKNLSGVKGLSSDVYAGSGSGGAPGAFMLILDGSFTPPSIGDWLVLNYGSTPDPGNPITETQTGPWRAIDTGTGGSDRDGASLIQFVPDNLTAEERTAPPIHQIATPSAPTLATYSTEPTTVGDSGTGRGWIKVSWTASSDPNARGYQFEAKRNSEAASEYQVVRTIEDATATNFKFQVTEGVQYNVRVRVLSDQGPDGHSAYSSAASATVSASSPNIREHLARAVDTSGTSTVGSVTVGGGKLIGASVETTSGTSAKSIKINATGDELEFYGDRGDTTIEKLCTIGITTSGSDDFVIYSGSINSGYNRISVAGVTYDTIGVIGSVNNTGYGTVGEALNSGYGVRGHLVGDVSAGAPLLLSSGTTSSSAPTHSALKGAVWITSAGVLYVNNNGSTGWDKIGAQ